MTSDHISPLRFSRTSTIPQKKNLKPETDDKGLQLESYEAGEVREVETPKPDERSVAPSSLGKIGLWTAAGLTVATGLSLLPNILGGGSAGKAPAPPAPTVEVHNPTVLTQMESEELQHRRGDLLGQNNILKFDQYPGLHRTNLEPVAGAPNFRGVEERGVYGVAQPTVEGLKSVLDKMGAKERTVAWTTMREEPVVYIQGRSYSLRLQDHPFANLEEHPGISTEQVEAQERQLKDEVLTEAMKNGGRILLHGESVDPDSGEFSLTQEWVRITPQDVQTPREVFEAVKKEGYQVDYARIPITDEQAPEDKDFDALVNRMQGFDSDTPLIFNCHAGRGRTTTSMVIADLMRWRESNPDRPIQKNDAVRADIGEQGKYQKGEYRVILEMINLLGDGVQSKGNVDQAIDRFEHIQNLREATEKYKKKHEDGKAGAEERGLHYLNRYFKLINFDAYLKEQAPKGFEKSFQEWSQERTDLEEIRSTMELAMHPSQSSQDAALA